MQLAGRQIGDGHPCFVIAEAGINHNGDITKLKRLVDVALEAGCDAVKFQKRTPELCVPRAKWDVPRETPWGTMATIDYRRRIEFGEPEYTEIDRYCRAHGMPWFASCWDVPSVEFIRRYDPPAFKVASASLVDDQLLEAMALTKVPIIASTGMSSISDVAHAVGVLRKYGAEFALLQSTSAYPCEDGDIHLRAMKALDQFGVPVGYSGHERGVAVSVAAVAMGACIVERHITLDRRMKGSDHAASLEPAQLRQLVHDIRAVEAAMGEPRKRVLGCEDKAIGKLRWKR